MNHDTMKTTEDNLRLLYFSGFHNGITMMLVMLVFVMSGIRQSPAAFSDATGNVTSNHAVDSWNGERQSHSNIHVNSHETSHGDSDSVSSFTAIPPGEVQKSREIQRDWGHLPVGMLVVIFAICVLLTKLGVDVFCKLAARFGLVDKPDANRRLQKKPVPVGGGVVIFLTSLITLAGISLFAPESISPLLFASPKILFPLFVAAAFLVGVGLADDKWELGGRVKLLSQIAVATIVIAFANNFTTISLLGMHVDLGHMFYPLGILWLVGIINAVNFLDGADGVAVTTGLFMTVVAGIFAFITGQTTLFIISLVFSGALVGFLFCNFPPAKVYLGDTGSMLIGLVVGVLLLRSCTVENRVMFVLPPLAIAMIPIFDTCLSFFRRMSSGRGLFSPDRAHIHHRLLVAFQSNKKILGCLGAIFLGSGILASLGMVYRNDGFPLVAVVGVPVVLIVTGLFGKEEMKILLGRFHLLWKKRWHKRNDRITSREFRYQGNGPWDELWQDLSSSLRGVRCLNAHLDINIPFLHESYVSRLDNHTTHTRNSVLFSCAIPLHYESRDVGTLEVSFRVDRHTDNAMIFHFANELGDICVKYITDFIQSQKHTEPAAIEPVQLQHIQPPEEMDIAVMVE
jgi:UDP-GlcNAc:undecaprenyl-phosphate GlcNAc-1-phosphate transferase